jgi:hypothetical protein
MENGPGQAGENQPIGLLLFRRETSGGLDPQSTYEWFICLLNKGQETRIAYRHKLG